MKKLMKSAMLLASVGATLCFAGCNSVGDKPEEVVIEVLKKMQSGTADLAFLNKYCEEDTAKLFSGFGAKMTAALKGATFVVANVFVDDDVAVVKIKQEGGERPGESYYDAKKIDGQWKIEINKEAHSDYCCISQKTISECVEAFKGAFSQNGDSMFKERCTKEFWDKIREMVSKAPSGELKEFQESINALRIKGHEKDSGDSVGIAVEMPFKGVNGQTYQESKKLILKVYDGHWKLSDFER